MAESTESKPVSSPLQGWLGLNWAVVMILSGLTALGALAGLPLAIDLARLDPAIAAGLPQTPTAYYLLGLSMALQTLVLYGLFVVIGLWCGARVGLGAPVLDALTRGRGLSSFASAMLARAFVYGIAAGIVVVAIDWIFFIDRLPPALTQDASPLLNRLLAGMGYGGFNEEIKWRLMTVSVFAFLAAGAWRGHGEGPSRRALMLAVVLAAFCCAVFHLATVANVTALTPLVVSRTLVMQTLLALAFGFLFVRDGIETAILAHIGAQLPLQLATGF